MKRLTVCSVVLILFIGAIYSQIPLPPKVKTVVKSKLSVVPQSPNVKLTLSWNKQTNYVSEYDILSATDLVNPLWQPVYVVELDGTNNTSTNFSVIDTIARTNLDSQRFYRGIAYVDIATSTNQVGVLWDPSSDMTVIGYKVYIGTSSRTYSDSYDAGILTSYNFTNLVSGQRYYITATTYNILGDESDYAQELVYVAPWAGWYKLPFPITQISIQ